MLVTHLHRDHFDDTAKRLLDKHLPLFCQPPDTERLHADGFTHARPVHADAKLHDILIERTEGQHGTGEIGEQMAPVSGFVLAAPAEPTVYIAGDTILCDEVRHAVSTYAPDVIVVNASAAQFNEGGPIVMDNDDVVAARPRGAGRADRRRALRVRQPQHRDARGPARAARTRGR